MAITISGDSPNFTSVAATTVNGVTTLNSSSGVLATQNGMTGIAKAWVNFNGTGTVSTNQTIRASFNVSSVFKNATGDYTVTFTTAMPDANYAVVAAGSATDSIGAVAQCVTPRLLTTSNFRVKDDYNNGSYSDFANNFVAVFSS